MAQTVMVVDDNAGDIEITKLVFDELGRKENIIIARHGKEALRMLEQEKDAPALVLLDLKLPGMSGLDVLRELRSESNLKHIPVVIVTSSVLESDEKESYEAGADAFLHKDFDITTFSSKLNTLLERYLVN